MIPRSEVYAAVDGERDYQDNLHPGRTDGKEKSVGDFLTLIREYSLRADEAYIGSPGDEPALHMIRKITALGVQCMEKHGAPTR